MKFEISDWVQAKTRNGEFIHGFIEALDNEQTVATVFVVQSDNEQSIGKPAAVLTHWLREIPVTPIEDSGQIHNLIDIALSIRDEIWFNELTDQLMSIPNTGDINKSNNNPITKPTYTNRMGYRV
jgi:hypothetical protein